MRCEQCGAEVAKHIHQMDYCAICGKDLCPKCMKEGCCRHKPAMSGLDTERFEVYEEEEPRERKWF